MALQAATGLSDTIREGMSANESPELLIKRFEKAAESNIRRSYIDGHPVEEIIESAPVLKVGLMCLPERTVQL